MKMWEIRENDEYRHGHRGMRDRDDYEDSYEEGYERGYKDGYSKAMRETFYYEEKDSRKSK